MINAIKFHLLRMINIAMSLLKNNIKTCKKDTRDGHIKLPNAYSIQA